MSTMLGFTLQTDNPRIFIEVVSAGKSADGEQRWRVYVMRKPDGDGSSLALYRSLASSRHAALDLATLYCKSINVTVLTPNV